MRRLFCILTLLLISAKELVAQTLNPLTTTQIQKLDAVATQDVPPAAPGIATAILLQGEVLYQKWAGYADLRDSTLITPDSRFNIASNGKQFTALAVLTLIDQKKLKLSDDIRKWFPELFPKVKEKITIQTLLNHTSGIRDCYDLWSLQGITWWKQTFDNSNVLNLIRKQEALNFAPNTQYLYSNTNYILLALIIEKVSGQSFVAYTKALFSKLNMPNTSFENNYRNIRGPIAKPYFNFETWTTYDWITNVCGDGNIFSTLSDQIQWEKIIQGNGATSVKRNLILQSQQIIENSTFKNYGYGLEFGQYKGLDYAFHEGATGAWKATVIRFPAKSISFITLTNTGKALPYSQTRQMADIVLGLKADADYLVTEPTTIGKYVDEKDISGTYLTETDFAFTFELKDSIIYLKRIGRNDVELERESANIFHQKYDPAFKQEFKINSRGEMEVTAYYISHTPYTLTKTNASFHDFDFQQLSGTFLNTETNIPLEILYKSDKTYEIKFGKKKVTTGLWVSPSKLLVDNYAIDIHRSSSRIDTLYLNGDRIKNIQFVRQ